MVFSSAVFVFAFLPAVLICYGLADRFGSMRVKNFVLLFFSLVFYAWGGLGHFALLLVLVLCNYGFGLWIGNAKKKKPALAAAVAVDLGVLGYFKYFNFFTDNLGITGMPRIALPIGISFFTFQILSYLIDVYRGNVPPQRNLMKLALYILLFPQLVAGPIVRYADINREIDERNTSPDMLAAGIKRFILGFAKKVLLANAMGKVADTMFSIAPESLPALYAWAGALCYALQIFLDFSAYSDMAIGMGQIFGFRFRENFDQPYSSRSIREFWRRWHISLSSWFRDYVYIPLGGNRKGKSRTLLNLLIVFFLTGLWHGANWTFICWGLFHGALMLLERGPWGKIHEKLPSILRRIMTLFAVLIGWVLFRADSLPQAGDYFRRMFMFSGGTYGIERVTDLFTGAMAAAFILSLLACIPALSHLVWKGVWNHKGWGSVLFLLLFVVSAGFLLGGDFNPFIYFQF